MNKIKRTKLKNKTKLRVVCKMINVQVMRLDYFLIDPIHNVVGTLETYGIEHHTDVEKCGIAHENYMHVTIGCQ